MRSDPLSISVGSETGQQLWPDGAVWRLSIEKGSGRDELCLLVAVAITWLADWPGAAEKPGALRLALTVVFTGLALLFLQLDAQFAGFAQILVYVGAVAILVVFAILLTRSSEMPKDVVSSAGLDRGSRDRRGGVCGAGWASSERSGIAHETAVRT